jgi:UDP:flavonoid glycosyltransferase YjiC (YdhE family)
VAELVVERGSFLFVGLDTGGTWKPILGLARWMVLAGHRATVLGSPSMRATSEAAGCSFVALPESFDEPPGTALEDDGFESWVGKVCGPAVAEAVPGAAADSGADVVVSDFLQFNALSAAELLDHPLATVVHFGMEDWGEGEGWEDEVALLNLTRERLGLAPLPPVGGMGRLWGQADVALCVIPLPWLPEPLPNNVVVVGPIAAAPRSAAPTALRQGADPRPLVVISMSSTYMHQEELLSSVATTVSHLPVQVVLSLAGAVPSTDVSVPARVEVRDWVEFDDIFPSTDLLITHGGMATAASAMAHGVPMILLPQSRDQHLNASRVAEQGAGLVLPKDSPPAAVRAAVEQILNDPRFRESATDFSRGLPSLRAGQSAAVGAMETLLAANPA